MTSTSLVLSRTQTARLLRRPSPPERWLASLTVVIFAVSLPTEWFISRQDAEATGGPLTQLTFLSLAGVAVLGLNGNWHIALTAVKREPILAALMGWIALSALWSTTPVETATATITLLITYLIALYFMVRFTPTEIIRIVAIGLAVSLFINFAMVFAFPESGIQTLDGQDIWSGAFRSRNSLGRLAVISVLIFATHARLARSRIMWPGLSLLAALQIYQTGSVTSAGALVGTMVLAASLLGFRGRRTLYGATTVTLGVVFSSIVLVTAVNLEAVTALFGREATFTGRLPLWQNSIEYGVVERPWLGYGWGGFWTGGGADFDVLLRTNFDAPHSHNAFLEAWLYGGPIATVLLVALFVRGMFWGARNIRRNPSAIGLFPMVIICQAIIYSLSEAGFISRSIQFILLIIGITMAAENKTETRSHAPIDPPISERLPVKIPS